MAWVQCCECGKNGDSEDMVPMGAVDYGDHEEEEYMCEDCYDNGENWYPLEDYERDAEFAHQSRIFETYGDYLPYTEK